MTERPISVGSPAVVESNSPSSQYASVFEDDGETGYFYAIDLQRATDPILAALHVYDVESIEDRARASQVKVLWSSDGLRSALLINEHPHAVIDFQERRGYCRTNSPAPNDLWTDRDYAWDESMMRWFR